MLHALVADGRAGKPAPIAGPSVAEWFSTWLHDEANGWKPTTAERYRDIVRLYIVPALGNLALGEVRPADVSRCLAGCAGVSGSTRLKVYRVLRRGLAAAIYAGLAEANPCALVEAPRAQRRPVGLWTPQEAARFVSSLRPSGYGPLWAVLLGTGCRLGEALALRWGDYAAESGTVRISATYCETRQWRGLTGTKTAAGNRTVTLPGFARALLDGGPSGGESAPIFLTARGKTPTRALVGRAFKNACKAAGVPAVRVHDLRHLHASLLLADGLPVPAVAARLGHASPAVTMAIYAHALRGSEDRAAKAIDEALGVRPTLHEPAFL
jgi:integrase